MRTALTSLLGLDVPIVQGGMAWVSGSRLAAAVSEAGALGVLGSATMSPEELRDEIRAVRARTSRPFAVNLPLIRLRPDGEDLLGELAEVILSEDVRVVITGAGSPAHWTPRFQEAGLIVGHVVPSPRLARKACDAGVDFVVAESSEAGGHVRAGGLATLSLVPQVVDAVPVPVVAAGGIADGRGVVAALALGAGGVQMGTRFVATQECEAHPAFKGCVVRADAEEAVLYGPTSQLSRGLTTPPVRRMLDLAAEGASQERLAEERGRDRARRGCVLGEVEEGILPAGSGVGLVRGLPTVAELIDGLMKEARATLGSLGEAVGEEPAAATVRPSRDIPAGSVTDPEEAEAALR
jgi:enoyl-[acyl-carrier protein] reductase II